jgi:hypothetical protein
MRPIDPATSLYISTEQSTRPDREELRAFYSGGDCV